MGIDQAGPVSDAVIQVPQCGEVFEVEFRIVGASQERLRQPQQVFEVEQSFAKPTRDASGASGRIKFKVFVFSTVRNEALWKASCFTSRLGDGLNANA
jgi:hypothetical protein